MGKLPVYMLIIIIAVIFSRAYFTFLSEVLQGFCLKTRILLGFCHTEGKRNSDGFLKISKYLIFFSDGVIYAYLVSWKQRNEQNIKIKVLLIVYGSFNMCDCTVCEPNFSLIQAVMILMNSIDLIRIIIEL